MIKVIIGLVLGFIVLVVYSSLVMAGDADERLGYNRYPMKEDN